MAGLNSVQLQWTTINYLMEHEKYGASEGGNPSWVQALKGTFSSLSISWLCILYAAELSPGERWVPSTTTPLWSPVASLMNCPNPPLSLHKQPTHRILELPRDHTQPSLGQPQLANPSHTPPRGEGLAAASLVPKWNREGLKRAGTKAVVF